MKTITTVTVVLEIEGEAEYVRHAVDSLLGAGFFQDAINDCELQDEEGTELLPLHVVSAMVRSEPQESAAPRLPRASSTAGSLSAVTGE